MYEVFQTRAPKGLSTLFVGDGNFSYEPIAMAPLWNVLPRIRTLTLGGAVEQLGAPPRSALETLRLRWANRATLDAVAKASWPALKRLHVTLLDERCEGALGQILDAKHTPALEHVSVRRWFASERGDLIAQDDVALLLVRLAAARRLEELDLEMPISTHGARALLGAIDHLRAIRTVVMIPKLMDADVRKALVAAHPGITWAPAPEEEALELMAIDATELQPFG
jgi:hypothetical protein